MRALHFDCFSGISGDMTLAALLDAGADADVIRAGIDSLRLPIQLQIERVRKGGFAATQVFINVPEEKEHRYLSDIEAILAKGVLRQPARELALRIFHRLAEAEAAVHGMALDRVHFHEVGALDSIADIAGVAIALDSLGVERITSRSVPTGVGTVKCAHGIMPIPTPATALLLKGAPLAASSIKAELTTPTGAAILATVVQEWVESPAMTVRAIGVGAGTKDFIDQPNVLRVFIGDVEGQAAERDQVWVLETNLDDVPGEVVGFCVEELFAAGALDVYSIPIGMKKNRPGVLLGVIAPLAALEAMETILFRQTGTFGVRRHRAERVKLQREALTLETPWGSVKAKRGWCAGLDIVTPEYEDCARVAREHGVPLREVYDAVKRLTTPAVLSR